MKETELKPCPFCGHKDITVHDFDAYDGYQGNCTRWFARCRLCGAAIERKSKAVAINSWNRRADNEQRGSD
jgi:Lar family restriction alleviation protein